MTQQEWYEEDLVVFPDHQTIPSYIKPGTRIRWVYRGEKHLRWRHAVVVLCVKCTSGKWFVLLASDSDVNRQSYSFVRADPIIENRGELTKEELLTHWYPLVRELGVSNGSWSSQKALKEAFEKYDIHYKLDYGSA